MRAIAFLIAAFAFLAACNRPVTAERLAASERATVAPRANAADAAKRPQAREPAEPERAVDRGIPDDALTENVREALLSEKGLSTRDLQVVAKNGVVTISGTIEERSDQERMLLVAKSVDGVRSVVSRLVLEADRPA